MRLTHQLTQDRIATLYSLYVEGQASRAPISKQGGVTMALRGLKRTALQSDSLYNELPEHTGLMPPVVVMLTFRMSSIHSVAQFLPANT
jgi:hypothetical protein